MSPAEADVRRFLSFAGFGIGDRMTLPIAHAQSLLSELDALRARCEAAEKLLQEAQQYVDPYSPVGARIRAHQEGAGRE